MLFVFLEKLFWLKGILMLGVIVGVSSACAQVLIPKPGLFLAFKKPELFNGSPTVTQFLTV